MIAGDPVWLFDEVKRVLASDPHVLDDPLYRLTESYNLGTVLQHGTDRYGRPDSLLPIEEYGGRSLLWSQVIYASTEPEVIASLRPTGAELSSAFRKWCETPDAVVLVYRKSAMVKVADRQYTLLSQETFKTALVAVLTTVPTVERRRLLW
jgi:hypothetical protein